MREVRHGIAIGLICVFAVVGIGSTIAQAMSDGPEGVQSEGDSPAMKTESPDIEAPVLKEEGFDEQQAADEAKGEAEAAAPAGTAAPGGEAAPANEADEAAPADEADEKAEEPAETN